MQWETPQSESFTRRQVRQVHTITEDGYTTRTERHYSDSSSPNRYGQYVNGSVSNGIESNYGTSHAKRTIYMLNGDTSLDEGADQLPYKKRESDSSETGSLPRTYSSGSSTGRRVSRGSVGSTGGTKISSVTLPIRSSSFSTARRTSGSVESPVYSSSTPKTESAPSKPATLPRTSSLTRPRISSDSKSGPPTVNVKYNIKLILGEVKGNGTDGNVYIQLFGAKGNTAKIQLRQANDDKNRFEPGQEYKFEVTTLDIGKIERIKLSHDHMEYGTGFHVKEVHIDVPAFNSRYSFPCNVWLAQDHPAEATTVKDLNETPPLPNKGYTVSVRLGKVFDPYTKLYLQLCGEDEESSKIVLRPSGSAADTFQEGKTYKFSVEMPDIGKVERIRVGHDSHGPGKGIFLDEVEVTPDEEAPVFFPGSCWLAEDIGDGRTEREIYPGTRTPHTSVSDITHTVSVRMGEVLNPDATLFIYLIGRKGETSKVFLKPEEPLEREKAYKFTLALPVDIGKIEKIRLGQDSKGYGKGLFIDSVRVSPIDGDVVVFPCACWLAEDVWDSKTERELIPGQAVRRPENTAYNLTFKTGDMPGAGTDANVTLQLFGDRGRTEKVMLRQQRGKSLKRFDRGCTDRFTVQTMDVGKVERIRLSHDNSGRDPEWYLESLKIEIPSRDEKYYFPCNRWLTGDEDKRVEVEVYPVNERQVVEEPEVTVSQQTVDSFAPPEPEPEPSPPTAEYQVSFQLGKVTDPDSRLYMVIHGDNGDSEKVYLTSKGDRLRPGKYHVKVRTVDVGNVRNVSIGQEGGSPDRGVFVEEVEVCAPRGPPVIFPCRCWLAEDEGDNKVTRVLVPGETPTSPYDISFRLGEVLDPNAKLFMILYGDRGESGKIYLEAPDGKQFEPGVTYKVSTDIEDVGKLQSIYLGNDSPGRGRGVFVEEIEVCAADDNPVIFPCCCWLDENEGDGKKARVLVPGESIQPPYKIIYRLGEVADPRAKLYMIIDGNRGESRKIDLTPVDGGKLKPSERYSVPVYINDIGKIDQIRIGNDSYGRGRGVFIEEIEVVAPDDDPVVFPCRCWLAEDEGDGKTTRVLVPGETIEPQPETTLYNMTFETGDVPFAGTDSMVSVQLCGEKCDTQKIAFGNGDSKSPSGKFKRGRIDKFAVETVDVGKLNKVHIEHNNVGSYPDWFLKEMTIEVPARDETYVFRHNNWIGGEGIDLDPCDDKAKSELYTIHLRLGEVADPKAPVWIQLLGEKGESGQIQIKPGYDSNGKFEKGRTYKVVARVADIGRIMDVRVGQEPSAGNSRGLYVEEVEVTASRGGSERFPCKCWTVEPEPALDTAYQVTFKTGDRESAGTDAKVYFQLFGDKGKTEMTELCQDKNLRLFDKGNSDKFKVETLDVGKINKLVVGRDESGRDPDWYLEEVTIDVRDKNEQYLFPCHRWLCGSQREVTLFPEETKDLSQEVDYRIMVKTGDEVGAGTDANVFLQMIGEKGKTQMFKLREEGDKRRFERGRMDKFVIRTQDIGKLNGLRICRDNKGRNPDWLLDRVNIDVTEKDEHYVFYCNQWLRSSDPVDLTHEDSFLPEQDGMYTVDVEIGDVLDPNVNPFYQITGKNGETNKIRLRDGYSKNHVFVKNQSYQVSVRSPDVGEITKLRIGDDSFSQGRTIFIKKVTIINKNGETAVFPCYCWLGKDDYGSKIIREFKPEDEFEDLLYELTIKTGDKDGAGTDANVSFVLQGENGETPRITLQDERNTFTRFQAGMAEKFDVRTKDVGKLEKLVIGHDNKGSSPNWYLDEVDVYIRERNERYKFRCGQWIGGGAPNQQTEAVLYPVPDDIDGPIERETHCYFESPQVDEFAPEDSEYDLQFKTANKENAGTDCNVFFRMIGEEGETEEIEVNNRARGYFRSGQLDRFRVRAKNVGRLEMIHLRQDNSGSQSQWLLDEVVIYSLSRGERYVFKGGHWTGGRNNEIDIPRVSWNSGQLVGQEPDIPDLIDYMQSGDTSKIINAAGYLQHLCYTKESVKDKVRELGGIPVIVRLLTHSVWSVRYAAICLLRNLSFSVRQDANRLAIADCGGIEELINILQQTERIEYREAIVSVLCNLSSVESLRLRILLACLHVIVTVVIITYSEWTLVAARGQLPVRTEPWPAVLVHATRLVRNLSSAGLRARQELRDEKGLVDCLVWIIRIGVKSEQYDNKCLEHSVCTLRNLSYRLESEVDRDRYDDANVDVDPAAVKEQQSQGCFAGCGGRKKKKVPADKRPTEGPKDQPQGTELIWQPQTVQQYYVLLRKSKNYETLEGSAGAIHNLTACSWKWAIKIRADTRKAHAIPLLVQLLTIDYDPTIRAAAIALRNLSVDSENKKVAGEKAMVNLVSRLPTGEEEKPRLVTDPTLASILCAIHQLTNKSEKNVKYLRKTKGIQRMVRVAKDQEKNYSPRVIKIANQVLANLWIHAGLQQQMKSEGWKYDAAQISEMARAPLDYEATSLPGTPSERSRQDANRNRLVDDRWRSNGRRVGGNGYSDAAAGTDLSSESDRQRSWVESLNQIPPPYASDDDYSRGSRSREEMALGDTNSSARQSAAGSERDETDSRDGRTLKLTDSGGGGGKKDDLWV